MSVTDVWADWVTTAASDSPAATATPEIDAELRNIKAQTKANCVDMTAAQTVNGVKTFGSFPITPSSAPTTNYQVANKKYVDDSVPTNTVLVTGDQTVAGVKTFSSFPVGPSSAPTTDYQLSNKKYVDDAIVADEFAKVHYVKCSYSVSSGTGAQSATYGGWAVLPMLVKDADYGSIATLATNQITLPAGTYYCRGVVTAIATGAFTTKVWNVTGAATLVLGMATYATLGTDVDISHSSFGGYFVLSSQSAIEVRYYAQAAGSLGAAVSTGENEVYAFIELWKTA